MRSLPLLLVMACSGKPTAIDAPPIDESQCTLNVMSAGCLAGSAFASTSFTGGTTSQTRCYAVPVTGSRSCATGCAVTATVNTSRTGQTSPVDIAAFTTHPQVMCAETPEAQVNDPCTPLPPFGPNIGQYLHDNDATAAVQNAVPCLPTRAHLNPDGTVAGQPYLSCDGAHCVAAQPPTIANYLQPCDAAVVAQHTGATGAIATSSDSGDAACLLASDGSGTANAMSIQCIGDWECPDHALCDDQITNLGTSAPMAVCKPGPRGTLTRTMLGQ